MVRLTGYPLAAERGGWCDDCALPSLLTVTCAVEIDGKPWQLVTVACCTECLTEQEIHP